MQQSLYSFKTLCTRVACLSLLIAFQAQATEPVAISNLIPAIQTYTPPNDAIKTHLGIMPHIFYFPEDPQLKTVATTLSQDLQTVQPKLLGQPQDCPKRSICLIEDPQLPAFNNLNNPQPFQLQQGYQINLKEYSASITSRSSDGIFNGTRTLLQLIAQATPIGEIPAGTLQDWPALQERGMMLDLGRKFFPLPYLQSLIKTMAFYKLNELHLHLNESFMMKLPGQTAQPSFSFRLDDPIHYPYLATPNQNFSQEDIEKLKQVAENYHITLVPEIDIPGHASAITQYYQNIYAPSHPELLQKYPSIGFDPKTCPTMASMTIGGVTYSGWTIDVLNPEALSFVEGLVQNFMPWFGSENGKYPHQGKYFHIGTDEYQNNAAMNACPELIKACTQSDGSILKACQGPSNPNSVQSAIEPGGLFVNFINQINQDIFIHGNNPDHTQMRIWTGWNAATPSTPKYSTSPIDPDSSILIDSWLVTQPLSQLMQKYQVMNTSYQITYLTPGYADQSWDNPFPQAYVLNHWQPDISLLPLNNTFQTSHLPARLDNNIGAGHLLGTSFSLWTDSATIKPFWFFDTLLQRPMKLLANAAWMGGSDPTRSLSTFVNADQAIGAAPGLTPVQHYYPFRRGIHHPIVWETRGAFPINQNSSIGLEDLSTPWTFKVWIHLSNTAAPNASPQILLQSPLTDNNDMPLSLNLMNPNTSHMGYVNGTNNQAGQYSMVGNFDLPYALPQGSASQWEKLVFVGTQQGVALYINGKYQGSSLSVMPLPMQYLGSSQNTLQGTLCNPTVYDIALPPSSPDIQPSHHLPPECLLQAGQGVSQSSLGFA